MNNEQLKMEPLSFKLNLVYSRLVELTDGEEDPELSEYNEFLLDVLSEARHALLCLETRRKEYGEKL